jgi:hypothetical protein
MTWRQTFAKMIGVPEHQAEDALHSERAAHATLTRRNLFAGGAALAAGSAFSFAAPEPAPLPIPPWLLTNIGAALLPGLFMFGARALLQAAEKRA